MTVARMLILVLVVAATYAAEDGFTPTHRVELTDGRVLIGVYDEQAEVVKVRLGKATGSVPAKRADIQSVKPFDAGRDGALAGDATASPQPAPAVKRPVASGNVDFKQGIQVSTKPDEKLVQRVLEAQRSAGWKPDGQAPGEEMLALLPPAAIEQLLSAQPKLIQDLEAWMAERAKGIDFIDPATADAKQVEEALERDPLALLPPGLKGWQAVRHRSYTWDKKPMKSFTVSVGRYLPQLKAFIPLKHPPRWDPHWINHGFLDHQREEVTIEPEDVQEARELSPAEVVALNAGVVLVADRRRTTLASYILDRRQGDRVLQLTSGPGLACWTLGGVLCDQGVRYLPPGQAVRLYTVEQQVAALDQAGRLRQDQPEQMIPTAAEFSELLEKQDKLVAKLLAIYDEATRNERMFKDQWSIFDERYRKAQSLRKEIADATQKNKAMEAGEDIEIVNLDGTVETVSTNHKNQDLRKGIKALADQLMGDRRELLAMRAKLRPQVQARKKMEGEAKQSIAELITVQTRITLVDPARVVPLPYPAAESGLRIKDAAYEMAKATAAINAQAARNQKDAKAKEELMKAHGPELAKIMKEREAALAALRKRKDLDPQQRQAEERRLMLEHGSRVEALERPAATGTTPPPQTAPSDAGASPAPAGPSTATAEDLLEGLGADVTDPKVEAP